MRALACAEYLSGQYGVSGTYVGVPVVIGASGLGKVSEIASNKGEEAMFDKSVQAVSGLTDAWCKIVPAVAER